MFTKHSEDKIISWIKNEEMEQLGKYLLSGTIHGKPGVPVAELGRIEKIAKKNLSETEQYELAKKLLKRSEYTARNIGTHLLASGWPDNKDVESYIKKAADDEDWIVREYAAGAFATLLEKDFIHFSKLYLKWLKTESVNIKRAIALAVKYESKSAESKKWKVYFDLINPLMEEEAEYIRKNLGPFAIGDGLLSRYPDQVLSSCKKWIKSGNENVRWNAAMIFTAAAARKFSKEGKSILRSLEKDDSAFVSRAAKKALKNLEK
jgi:HEAT repeat protein